MYDTIFGALVIATWINTVLLMLEAIQVVKCLVGKTRGMLTNSLVLWCFLIDVACSAVNCAGAYLYTVSHWGDAPYSMDQHWPMSVQPICTGTVAFSVQVFLIVRYYVLSHNLSIALMLVLVSLASLGGAISCSVILFVHSSYAARHMVAIPGLIWLSASVVADWAIAAMLVWEIQRRKPRFIQLRTDGIIRGLTKNAIRTGSVTSFFATVALTAYFIAPRTNVPVAFGMCLGRMYSLTMLYNINNRGGLPSHSNNEPRVPSNEPLRRRRVSQGGVGVLTTGLSFTRLSLEDEEMTGTGIWTTRDSAGQHTQRSYRDQEWSDQRHEQGWS